MSDEDAFGLWQPIEPAAPAQDGERMLLVAVLEEALACYRRYAWARDGQGRQLFTEVQAWLDSSDRTDVFTFESICDALDLDASYLRRGLREWRECGRPTLDRPAQRARPRVAARLQAPARDFVPPPPRRRELRVR